MKNKHLIRGSIIATLLFVIFTGLAFAQAPERTPLGHGFTYQGQLKSSGTPYTGTCDFQFGVYDALTMGVFLADTTKENVAVTEGYFTVHLDFGDGLFNGENRWLEIWVRCPSGGGGSYTQLQPRQALTAAPYALFALKADHALLADSVPWLGISGMPLGFADGVDDDTKYNAGEGLSLVGTTFSVDTTYLQRRVTSTCTAGSYIREIAEDGTITCEPVSATVWSLSGNTATIPGTNYLGTTDAIALVLKVNNKGALRLEPNSTSPSLIGGYFGNFITSGIRGATIGGGGSSLYTNGVFDNFGTVGGGERNRAGDPSYSATYATVGGGYWNTASGSHSTVGGGNSNTASGDSATVSGGVSNVASGAYSIVAGGVNNIASGISSFAAGRGARANYRGCFVWGDSSFSEVDCEFDNQFVARASGGVYFYTDSSLNYGMYLDTGGSSWNAVSNRALKENFTPVDTEQLLANLAQYPIHTWNYKSQDEDIVHVGMMADEFNALIDGLGGEGADYINSMDATGVALAAIQGLYAENQELKGQIDNLEARLNALEKGQMNSTANTNLTISWLLPLGLLACAGVWINRKKQGGGL